VESEAIVASAAVPAADERPAAFVALSLEPAAFLGCFWDHPSPLQELETSYWKEDQNFLHLRYSCFQINSSDLFSWFTMDTVLVVIVELCWLEITDLISVRVTN